MPIQVQSKGVAALDNWTLCKRRQESGCESMDDTRTLDGEEIILEGVRNFAFCVVPTMGKKAGRFSRTAFLSTIVPLS